MVTHPLHILQLSVAVLCYPLFFVFGRLFPPFAAFIMAFAAYWTLLAVGIFIALLTDERGCRKFKWVLRRPGNPGLFILAFLPAAAVFVLGTLPVLSRMSLEVLVAAAVVGTINGIFEELFWRGLTLAHFTRSRAAMLVSTGLFAAYHGAFALLPIRYAGGAAALLGSALVMGLFWLFIARRSRSIIGVIAAHVAVNILAFSALFIENGLIAAA